MAKSKKKARKGNGWGGKRTGAGRPVDSGLGKEARRNRVVAMVTDAELAKLERRAKKLKLPLGTLAYRIIERSIRAA